MPNCAPEKPTQEIVLTPCAPHGMNEGGQKSHGWSQGEPPGQGGAGRGAGGSQDKARGRERQGPTGSGNRPPHEAARGCCKAGIRRQAPAARGRCKDPAARGGRKKQAEAAPHGGARQEGHRGPRVRDQAVLRRGRLFVVVGGRQKVRHTRHQRAKGRPGGVPRVRPRPAHGSEVKGDQEALHRVLELLRRLRRVLAPPAEGQAARPQAAVPVVRLAHGHIPLQQERKVDQAVLERSLPR